MSFKEESHHESILSKWGEALMVVKNMKNWNFLVRYKIDLGNITFYVHIACFFQNFDFWN